MNTQNVKQLGLLMAALAWGCGEDTKGTPSESRDPVEDGAACAAAQLEDDSVDGPMGGPGVDPSDGRIRLPGERYFVSTTYLVLRPEKMERFGQLMEPLAQQLPTQPGLLAFQLKTSPRCGTARTLTVWESEEAMFGFVGSPAHLAAMREQPVVATPDSEVTSYEASADELTWQRAARAFERSPSME